MNKFIVLGLLSLFSLHSTAQKDPQAWKEAKSLEKQFYLLKENTSNWNGFVMIKEPQLNEFHKSILDSVKGLESTIQAMNTSQTNSKNEVLSLSTQLSETKSKLDSSLSRETELVTLGASMDKNAFPTIAYTMIIICVLIGAFAFFLYFRSNAITREIEKRNEELLEALKNQKAVALDRESKLARELQTERNKNYAAKGSK